MSNTEMRMNELIKNSMQINTGMIAGFPQLKRKQPINVDGSIANFSNRYCVRNMTISFVCNGKFYVTPFTNKAIDILNEAGLTEAKFLVPFSNGDYPEGNKDLWNDLCKIARISRKNDFEERCEEFSNENGIDRIEGKYLENSLMMPREGVKISHHFFENVYLPIISHTQLNHEAIEKIGTFCEHNGVVIFVYRDGNTYVTKGDEIISKLLQAGYKKREMFVPFSNGEHIENKRIKERWNLILEM